MDVKDNLTEDFLEGIEDVKKATTIYSVSTTFI